MNDKKSFLNILLCVAFFSAMLPIWVTRREMWDGVLIEYAFETLDMSGLIYGANASGWPVAGLIYKVLLKFQQSFSFPYWLGIDVFYTAALLGIAYEIFLFALHQLKLPHRTCLIVIILFFLHPIWQLLMSGIHMVHMLGLWFLLLGHRLSRKNSVAMNVFGWSFLTISFQYPAAIVMVFWLEGVHYLRSSQAGQKSYRRALFVAIYAATWYAIYRILFKPVEIFANYNQVQIPISIDLLKPLLWTGLKFESWLILLTCPLWIAVLVKQDFKKIVGSITNYWKIRDKNRFCEPIVIAAVGCVLACAPYIIVGKGPVLVFPFEWTSRHALPLSFPFSILVAAGITKFAAIAKNAESTIRLERTMLIAISTLWFSIGAVGLIGKLYQIRLEKAIESSLRSLATPPSGRVLLWLPFNPIMRIGPPETNAIFWRAYGKTQWAVMIGPPDSWVEKLRNIYVGDAATSLKNIKNQQRWYEYSVMGEIKTIDCETLISLKLPKVEQEQSGFLAWLSWKKFELEAIQEKTTCN